MSRFDKVRGGLSGDNLEREKVGIKEQKQARKADEATPKSADRHDDNLDRHAENVVAAKSFPSHGCMGLVLRIFHSPSCMRRTWKRLE